MWFSNKFAFHFGTSVVDQQQSSAATTIQTINKFLKKNTLFKSTCLYENCAYESTFNDVLLIFGISFYNYLPVLCHSDFILSSRLFNGILLEGVSYSSEQFFYNIRRDWMQLIIFLIRNGVTLFMKGYIHNPVNAWRLVSR